MDDDTLRRLIEELENPNPAETSVEIVRRIRAHKVYAFENVGRYIKMFEDHFDEIYTVIYRLNFVKKDSWSAHKGIQYLLYPEAMKTLHRAFEDMIDGYYDESMMLNRSVYETFLRIVFVSCYPREWEAIFVTRKDRMKFDVTSFVADHLRVDWRSVYRFMSVIAHSKAHRNLKKLQELSRKEADAIGLEYNADRKLLQMCVNTITFNMCILFHALVVVFGRDFDQDIILRDRSARLAKLDQVLLGQIETNSQPKYASRARDIVKIGKIIETADAGGDWQAVARQ
jgi:hypothetical protein